MSEAFRAEWDKLRMLAGTWWLLLGAVAAMAAVSAAACGLSHTSAVVRGGDSTKLALAGVYAGQVVVATGAILTISEEFATGMIRVTLAAIPHRLTMLAAKATATAGLTAMVAIAAVTSCLALGRALLPSAGLNPTHGYALVSIAHGATLRATAGTVIYLVLIALLALGLGTVIRDTAVSIGVLVALLLIPPLLAHIVGGSAGRRIEQLGPMRAGLSVQATTHLHSLPIAPWSGLGVCAAWAATSLAAAAATLRLRDA